MIGRKMLCSGEVVEELEKFRETCGRILSKRLHPFLPELFSVMKSVE